MKAKEYHIGDIVMIKNNHYHNGDVGIIMDIDNFEADTCLYKIFIKNSSHWFLAYELEKASE